MQRGQPFAGSIVHLVSLLHRVDTTRTTVAVGTWKGRSDWDEPRCSWNSSGRSGCGVDHDNRSSRCHGGNRVYLSSVCS